MRRRRNRAETLSHWMLASSFTPESTAAVLAAARTAAAAAIEAESGSAIWAALSAAKEAMGDGR